MAEGNLEVEIKGANRSDEIGEMARTVEVFRENALKITSMTDEERAASEQRRIERTTMMQALQQAFGQVVDAAQQGDFSKRVEAEFPDQGAQRIAASINNLVETVDRGLGETGRVLSALAQTDLTHRVEGDYQGSFEQLKTDTNAVAEKMTAFLFTGYGLKMYGRLERYQLYYVVAAIWAINMIVSPIWLRHFRFGPLEWAWRSLTYWKRQPMRLRVSGTTSVVAEATA